MTTNKIVTPEQWAGLRSQCVGASEVAALFSCHPYMTANKLYHIKRGNLKRVEADDKALANFGHAMEPIIGKLIEDRTGWKMEDRKEHMVDPEHPYMGCTVDRFVIESERGPGICQIKNVSAFSPGWSETRAPDYVELQVQHELAVTGLPWACIGALVGGNPEGLLIMYREPNTERIRKIQRRCKLFMERCAEGREPEVVDPKDFEHLATMFAQADTVDEEWAHANPMDEHFEDELLKYQEAMARNRSVNQEIKLLKAKILDQLMEKNQGKNTKRLTGRAGSLLFEVKEIEVAERTQTVKAHTQLRFDIKEAPDNIHMEDHNEGL